MIDRPKLKKPASDDDHLPPRQTRQMQQRYMLKIDGQLKKSFEDKESALNAGREIKLKFPAVKATVYDSQAGDNETC